MPDTPGRDADREEAGLQRELKDLGRGTDKRCAHLPARFQLRIRLGEDCRLGHRHGGDAHRHNGCGVMRYHAQRAVRGRGRGLCRQGIVHVHGLHEAEANHQQHEKHCHALLQQRSFGLAQWLHYDRIDISLHWLDVFHEWKKAENCRYQADSSMTYQPPRRTKVAVENTAKWPPPAAD